MSLKLPAIDSPLRELFDVADLAKLHDPQERLKLATLRSAIVGARRTFEADPAVRAVHYIVIQWDASLELIRFGPKGGKKTLWKFGKLGG